jgi:hypothetical protein
MDPVGLRVQSLSIEQQVLILGRLATGRSEQRTFVPADVNRLCDDIGLPRPSNTSYYLGKLAKTGLVTKLPAAVWKITPAGEAAVLSEVDAMDLAALLAEGRRMPLGRLGDTAHPVIPPWLAPPELLNPLRRFLNEFPFDTNVFGMTRFPDEDDGSSPDPVARALEIARSVSAEHGFTFHLASDRQIVDDLWPNVAAHLWGCRFGVAFFEDRRSVGINYNLTIEVGSALALGRRLAVLKDSSIGAGQAVERLPTDLTGKIYKPVDLEDDETIAAALREWFTADLGTSS